MIETEYYQGLKLWLR